MPHCTRPRPHSSSARSSGWRWALSRLTLATKATLGARYSHLAHAWCCTPSTLCLLVSVGFVPARDRGFHGVTHKQSSNDRGPLLDGTQCLLELLGHPAMLALTCTASQSRVKLLAFFHDIQRHP